jgi:DNA-binding PadR family transcriptional regulator
MKNENTQFAILGLLTTGCQTGYSIKQMMDGSLNHFWKISYGQIYPTLKLLADRGYASVITAEQESRPDKKVYNITSEGLQALTQWLHNPIQELPIEKNELLLKIFFSRHQDQAQTIEHLMVYKEKLAARCSAYLEIKSRIEQNHFQDADASYWIMTLDYGICITKAAMDWCDETKNKLSNEEAF